LAAIIAQESGEMDEALSFLEKARTIAESEAPLKRRKDVVRVLTDMGVLLGEMERLTEAMDKLREALWVAEPISAEVDMWTILVNLGLLADLQGQKDAAITYLERALQEARQQRSHDREGQCLLHLMQILHDVNPTKAYEYLHEIEKNFRDFIPFLKPHEKDLPHDWVEGMEAMEAGQYREGIAALEHLCSDKSPDAARLHPEALANRGNAHSRLGGDSRSY
jgi:tetratricopeptide (TPR) repeat protein